MNFILKNLRIVLISWRPLIHSADVTVKKNIDVRGLGQVEQQDGAGTLQILT